MTTILDLRTTLAKMPMMRGRRPESTEAERKATGAFVTLAPYRDGNIYSAKFSGDAADPEGRGEEPDQDRQRNPATQAVRQFPQAPVEIHQRTFSSELAARCASDSVRGSATSTVRCSVGRGVAVTMLTPFGA